MSRTVGAVAQWDTAQWGNDDIGGPYFQTWSGTAPVSDLATRIADVPGSSEGVSVGPHDIAGLQFIVEVLNPTAGVDAVWDSATWDTSHWSSSVGRWQDISDRVRGLTWTNGQGSPSDTAAVGTAAVTLNNRDGNVSPWASSGPFVDFGSRSWIRAGMLMRFGVYVNTPNGLITSGWQPFFTGKVEAVNEDTSDNVDGWVTLSLAETTMDLAVMPADQMVGDTSASGRMLTATLYEAMVAAGWGYQTSLLVPGNVALGSTGSGGLADERVMQTTLSGGSSMERMHALADCKHWDVVAAGDGTVAIVGRRGVSADGTPGVDRAVFSNAPTGSQLPIVALTPYSSNERVLNQISAARVNASEQVVEDNGSIEQFGLVTSRFGYPRTDLVLKDDAGVLTLIQRVLTLRAWDDLGIASFSLDADQDPANLPAVMGAIASIARYGAQWGISWTHPSGSVFTEHVVIEGQTHSITMEGSQLKWTATLSTGPAGPKSGR